VHRNKTAAIIVFQSYVLFLLILTPHFLQIEFNLILPFPFTPRCSPCISGFLNKEPYTFLIFSMHATCLVNFVLFDKITFKNGFYNQILFCESFSLQNTVLVFKQSATKLVLSVNYALDNTVFGHMFDTGDEGEL